VNVLVVLFAIVAGVAGSVQVAVMSKLGDRVGVLGALAWATSLAALLAIERDQHARRCRAVASDELDRLTDRGAGGDDVVDDQDPARERSADQGAALTVVLGLLAIEGEGQVA